LTSSRQTLRLGISTEVATNGEDRPGNKLPKLLHVLLLDLEYIVGEQDRQVEVGPVLLAEHMA